MTAAYSRLRNVESKIKKATISVANKVATYTRRQVAKQITAKVNIRQKDILRKGYCDIVRATAANNATATVVLSKTKRLQLIYFGARQNKTGVTYRIDKSGGKKLIRSAFIVERGAATFVTKRLSKARLPIAGPLRGPSAWGVFVKSGMIRPTRQEALQRLRKEMKEAVRVATLRGAGRIAA